MLFYLQMIDSPEDRSKFELIYDEYRDAMYAVAFSILHNKEDAEDAVHHAFLKLVDNIHKVSEAICPKTKAYVVTIVENRAIDIYRSKKKHPKIPYEQETVGMTIEYTGSNELASCLAKLSPRYREVLLLKHYHGYTSKEIAKMLGLSNSNVLKIEQRAKAKLETLCREAEIL